MPMPMPTDSTRWRCTGCGNLTRFEVVRRAVELMTRCAPETAEVGTREQVEPG
jgi:hypothetical protein